ncbi:hypothetical protein FACS1894190_05640 [Spirochaetia bacterium]|nr:hypothetical protein FACS1894190_05640 [Spirochaetia bacterium]
MFILYTKVVRINSVGGQILLAFAAAFVIKIFVVDFIITEGNSMLPVIENGRVLIVNRLAYGIKPPFASIYAVRWAVPQKGDIVVFWTPYGNLAVKRCAEVIAAAEAGNGNFFARGDNSAESFDSRSYGPVPQDNIIGKVLGIK